MEARLILMCGMLIALGGCPGEDGEAGGKTAALEGTPIVDPAAGSEGKDDKHHGHGKRGDQDRAHGEHHGGHGHGEHGGHDGDKKRGRGGHGGMHMATLWYADLEGIKVCREQRTACDNKDPECRKGAMKCMMDLGKAAFTAMCEDKLEKCKAKDGEDKHCEHLAKRCEKGPEAFGGKGHQCDGECEHHGKGHQCDGECEHHGKGHHGAKKGHGDHHAEPKPAEPAE
jgi:hypothetical protein